MRIMWINMKAANYYLTSYLVLKRLSADVFRLIDINIVSKQKKTSFFNKCEVKV